MNSKPKVTMKVQERIAQCKQQSLSHWENEFTSSILFYANSSRFAGLSDKQEAKLQDIEKVFALSRYYNEDGTKPFKEDTEDMKVITAPATITNAKPSLRPYKPYNYISPYPEKDDDIPF